MSLAVLLLPALLLAYANGANDNFKGVATLFGTGTASYRGALGLATGSTLLGSVAALLLGSGLIKTFSGHGLVPPAVTADPSFLPAVGIGAAGTVLLATLIGIPVSTTHALTGSLVGAGFIAASGQVQVATLGKSFVLPLLLSPFIALAATCLVYPAFKGTCRAVAKLRTTSGCFGGNAAADIATERERRTVLDRAHYASAGAVGFARGLNDTPKIAALLLSAQVIRPSVVVALVGLTIAMGGLLHARRVAETMSHRITPMQDEQGFAANLVTAFLVIIASRWGVPVSTTHVSCGAIFGLGAASGSARWKTVGRILFAWVVTLPLAALLGGLTIAVVALA